MKFTAFFRWCMRIEEDIRPIIVKSMDMTGNILLTAYIYICYCLLIYIYIYYTHMIIYVYQADTYIHACIHTYIHTYVILLQYMCIICHMSFIQSCVYMMFVASWNDYIGYFLCIYNWSFQTPHNLRWHVASASVAGITKCRFTTWTMGKHGEFSASHVWLPKDKNMAIMVIFIDNGKFPMYK